VRNRALRLLFGITTLIGLAAAAGCAGKNEVLELSLRTGPPAPVAATAAQGELKVLVAIFEDARPEKSRLGVRTHLGGGVTYFNLPGGRAGEAVSEAVAEYLRRKGWRARVGQPGTAEPGGAQQEGAPDVFLTGQVQELSADAKSRFGSTEIRVTARLTFRALNAADKSTTRVTVDSSRSQSVFWFEPEDVQLLLSEVFQDSLGKLVADTRVENRSLRLK